MGITWRFRLVRDNDTSSFIRRAEAFNGTVNEALQFANRVFEHFGDVACRVEAWSVGPIDSEDASRVVFNIARHENGRDWRLLAGRLTHPAWYRSLIHAVDYAAFRGRGYSFEIRVGGAGNIDTLIVPARIEPNAQIVPPFLAGAH